MADRVEWVPPDQAERDRIVSALDRNLLVEAGAGSGKTTAMVQRLVALILMGTATIDQIVAVTFTRKAAAELRERFQEALEQSYHRAAPGSPEAQRARIALDQLDACFLGTIHAFCARLLRERPLEAGVPPDFVELHSAEEEVLRHESWHRFIERAGASRRRAGKGSRLLNRLSSVGLAPRQLFGLYSQIADNGDLRLPITPEPPPTDDELQRVRTTLERLLTEAQRLLPRTEPGDGWDELQKRVRGLRFSREERRWNDRVELLNAALEVIYGNKGVVLNRWTGDRRHHALIRDLQAEFVALGEVDNAVRTICMRWLAHRYTFAVRFARAAAAFYMRERLRNGRLTFQDLLLRTAAMLRTHPAICRDLGERYHFLLIDEFQDTDPVQAEVLFRLAAETPSSSAAWLTLEPRPGALFVVGDPKQSIYRFRRADIALYLQAKKRFQEFGEVVELVANFRSTGRIARFVNAVFEPRFPATDDPELYQARFAPLRTRPARDQDGSVCWYRFAPEPGRGWIHITRPDSAQVAAWIRQRIERGERQPQDFLILTRTKHHLVQYAHALERNNVPYEISGAEIGADEELRELILLLRALSDPGNAVLTVAVLEGHFFGIDHDTLHEHKLAGGEFHLLYSAQCGTVVDDALTLLRHMWDLVRSESADVAIPMIVDELGVLPYAAAGELGATRTGALLYALDVLRQGSLTGRTTLADAIELLESALEREDAEAPLTPGASNLVRVMNLHRAKGLEARVVILANPLESLDRAPGTVQLRRADGSAEGWFAVFDATTRDRRKPIARPLHWDELELRERKSQDAEEDRLLYVAATRAAEELLVARCERMDQKSVWRCFQPLLDDETLGTELTIEPLPALPRAQLDAQADWFQHALDELRAGRMAQAMSSIAVTRVTAQVDLPESTVTGTTRGEQAKPAGPDWGEAVHTALHAAARGIEGESLRVVARDALLHADCPTDAAGRPLWLPNLLALVEAMRASDLWRRARNAQRVLYEVPFELPLAANESLIPGHAATSTPQVLTGRIDLAFEEHDGWVIADYKTDVAPTDVLKTRSEHYHQQLDTYAACWERITGQVVKEKLLVFTAVSQ